MSLISVILILVIVGVILWAVFKYVPMPPVFKNIILIIAVIAVLWWLLTLLGIAPNLGAIKVGH